MELISIDLRSIAQLIPLILLSVLAFWKENHILFMITAAVAMITGLYTPDMISGDYATTSMGIAIGLSLITFSLLCIALAFRLMFWKEA